MASHFRLACSTAKGEVQLRDGLTTGEFGRRGSYLA